MPRRSTRKRRHSVHPANETTSDLASPANRSTPSIPTPEPDERREPPTGTNGASNASPTNPAPGTTSIAKSATSFFTKLNEAKKSLFGRANTPSDPNSAPIDENRAFLSYVLTEPDPKLEVIQQFERQGAQLNCVTDESDTAIHLIARADVQSNESIQIIDYLIKQGCDPNRQNDYGWTAAHYSLASRNTNLTIFLLKVMIDATLATFEAHNGYPSQTQLLHIAARKNDSVLVRLLIKTYKARVNVFDEEGSTPLHICCYGNNLDALKALLENDADFQKGTRLNPNETPVSICVKHQHDACLRALFESAPSFNWKRYLAQLPRSPLLCDFPSVDAVELLVQHGLDINANDERGNTFLHYLVNKKEVDYEAYMGKLIDKSADFNRQNRLGRTPFLEALEQKNLSILAIFLAHRELINIHMADTLANTALHYCKYLDETLIYDSVLQSNPSALNVQNRDGQTPLHEAVLSDNLIFAQYLLQHGADPTVVNKEGNTPLHLAARDDNSRLCKLLLKCPQIDLTAGNKMGKTPLHLACAHEKPNIAAILINKMRIEQINLLDQQGRTPLHECAENIAGSLARYLIRHGADENAQDHRQNTALHLAAEKGNLELVRTLVKSSNIQINQLNADRQSPLGLAILYTHDEISKFLLTQEQVHVQSTDLTMAMQMNNYDMVKLLFEKDRNCLRVRSSTHGDMIIHIFMRQNLNNLVGLETLLSFISDNELLAYLSESSLAYGDNLLHIAAREDTPNALNCFLNLSRVKFWFWANMMLKKNNENKTPMELANEFKHYAIIKLINSKWKDSYEYLSHSLRDGHCGVSPTGVTQAKRQCFQCKQTGFMEGAHGAQRIRPCTKCNVCLYKSLDNSMQVFLALLFSDESSTIALDLMDSLVVTNEVQKSVHLYLDHIEPWEEFDRPDLSESSSLLNQLVYTTDGRKNKTRKRIQDKVMGAPLVSTTANPSNAYTPRPSIATRYRADGTFYRPITPLEAIYYHERLDLVTHPLIKGLVKWKWDNYAAKHFYIGLGLELIFLILWTCVSLLVPFPVRYVYRFPQDIWRCFLWAGSFGFLVWAIIRELFEIRYARRRYEDYLQWENERIEKNRYALSNVHEGKTEPTTMSVTAPIHPHHSQHDPLPPTLSSVETGTPNTSGLDSANDLLNGAQPANMPQSKRSRLWRPFRRLKERVRARVKSYYMYYSLNNLFDWIIYILCLLTMITHFIDVGSHTVLRARIHMYVASVTVICVWFRFMVFFRTISISAKTLRSKFIEIKLGELVIMVRMMFDDIIRFLLVFIFLLAPYAFVFFAVFGGRQIIHSDYEEAPDLCETALLYCPIVEIPAEYDGTSQSLQNGDRYVFNGTSPIVGSLCSNATDSCRILEASGFETFYTLLFTIFRIALVEEIPIDSFNLIDRYFASFVCGTYLLFTAILSINIFIGLISNALQTEAFSTVEARFLLERIEVILNYEWRLSNRKRLQLQEIIHRQCAPLQLNWKDINFNAFGQSREEQHTKALGNLRQTLEKHNVQFDTFRIQVQQKLTDMDTVLSKLQNQSTSKTPEKTVPKVNEQKPVLDEIARLRELFEESFRQPSPSRQTPVQSYPIDLNERVTDLQLSINRLHQDVGAIRQVLERISPLSTSLILGRTTTTGRR